MAFLARAGGRPRTFRLARAASAIIGLLLAGAGAAEEPLEQAVKSVYLFKFADYVEWPEGTWPDAAAPLVIGVLGNAALGDSLDEAVKGRTAAGRPVVVRRFDSVGEVEGVHVLYVSPSGAEGRDGSRAAFERHGVLTVGDKSAPAGAIIEFVRKGGKLRFEIDAAAARQAGLRLRSELLSLAVAVRGATR